MKLSQEEIASEIADLNLAFPNIAPRVIENLQMDRPLNEGFDTPVLKVLARYQIPVIIERMLSIGAYDVDENRTCGYSPNFHLYVTDAKGKSPAAKAAYFKSFTDVIQTKIGEGERNKMAALTLTVTEEAYQKLNESIWPYIKQFVEKETRAKSADARLVNLIYCAVIEEKK